MNLETTVHIWKEGSQYVAHAMPLDVMSSGPTPDSARQALDEAVRAFVLTAAEAGTLEQVLEDCGDERRGQDAISLLKMAAQGEADLQAGRFLPQDQVFARIRSRLRTG